MLINCASDMSESPVQIGPEELQRRLDAGESVQLLDVREVWEHEIARLEGATLIPLGELSARVEELDPEKPMVVYCHHGVRSYQAVLWLRQEGFPLAQNLAGGIDRWSQVINPMVVRYQ
jgi:rhodanese-related sulfurtransferase